MQPLFLLSLIPIAIALRFFISKSRKEKLNTPNSFTKRAGEPEFLEF